MHPPIRSYKDKRVAACVANISIALLALSIGGHSQDEQKGDAGENWNQQVKEQYAKHDAKIRKLLPPYSAMPLVLDLFHKNLEDGMCDPEKHTAWEAKFSEAMAGRTIADPGLSRAEMDATATGITHIDTFEPIYSLPAKRSSAIVIARPIAGRVCIPQSRRYLYTKFTLDLLKCYKRTADGESQQPKTSGQITAAELGGTVRFPSGFLETNLYADEGFLDVDKEYVIFMWKPEASDDMLVISQAYLIQDGFVFPVNTNGDAQTVYTKMPLPEFEAKVREAVKRNVDADVFPKVHAPSH